jgi:hypothetical protein
MQIQLKTRRPPILIETRHTKTGRHHLHGAKLLARVALSHFVTSSGENTPTQIPKVAADI